MEGGDQQHLLTFPVEQLMMTEGFAFLCTLLLKRLAEANPFHQALIEDKKEIVQNILLKPRGYNPKYNSFSYNL